LILVIGLNLILVTPALAGEKVDSRVILGHDFVLSEGETLRGDLVVFGGDVTLRAGSRVTGNVLTVGGNVTVAGEVGGDLVAFGGDVYLDETAVVRRDVATIGGQVAQVNGAVVEGEIAGAAPVIPQIQMWRALVLRMPSLPIWPRLGVEADEHWAWVIFRAFFAVIKAIFITLALTVLAALVVLFLPAHTEKVAQVVSKEPLASLGVGLVVAAGSILAIVLLAVTLCLSPLAFLLTLALLAVGLLGWIVIGLMVGKRLLEALQLRGYASFLAAALGTGLITLLSWLPCLGWLIVLGLGSLGFGAVVLTRFGTRAYPARVMPSARPGEPGGWATLSPPL